MKFLRSLLPSALLLSASVVSAASSWNFDEAVITVISKKTGAGAGFKDKSVIIPRTNWQNKTSAGLDLLDKC
jgi:hypothetical protein